MSCAERARGHGPDGGTVSVSRLFRCVTILCLALAALLPLRIRAATDNEAGTRKAWDMLDTAAASQKTRERTNSIRALGLLRNDVHARNLARHALEDPKPEVRVAAATALGQMRCTESIPWLRKLLSDKKLPVVMAAAHSSARPERRYFRLRNLLRRAYGSKKVQRWLGCPATRDPP